MARILVGIGVNFRVSVHRVGRSRFFFVSGLTVFTSHAVVLLVFAEPVRPTIRELDRGRICGSGSAVLLLS